MAAHDAGMNIVFFGASPILRHVRLQPSPLGPGREEVDYRDAAEDPLDGKGSRLKVTANTWGSPPTNWPESDFVGEMYAGFLEPGLVVSDASSWVYRGTGLHDGSTVPGVIGSGVDRFYPAMIHPAGLQVLSHSPIPAGLGQTDIGPFYSDMTYYTRCGRRAGVLDTETTNWIPALAGRSGCDARDRPGSNTGNRTGNTTRDRTGNRPGGKTAAGTCASAIVRRITGNILRAFGTGPGRQHPSVPNWRRLTGQ